MSKSSSDTLKAVRPSLWSSKELSDISQVAFIRQLVAMQYHRNVQILQKVSEIRYAISHDTHGREHPYDEKACWYPAADHQPAI